MTTLNISAAFTFALAPPQSLLVRQPDPHTRSTPRRPRGAPLLSRRPLPLRTPWPLQCALPARRGAHANWTCLSPDAGGATTGSDRMSVAPSITDAAMRRPASRRRLVIAFALIACVLALALVARSGALSDLLRRAEALITSVGVVRGSAMLFALNFCTVLFCFPANIGLMVASAAVLGAGPAFAALLLSKFLAACVAFRLARGVLAPHAQRALAARPRLAAALNAAGADSGWRFVLLSRLSPFPGFALNYLLSVTPVTFVQYALGTAVGIVPSVANLCLIGAAARDVGTVAAGGTVTSSWLAMMVRAFCMGSMLVVTVLATRRARVAFAVMKADDAPGADIENGISGEHVAEPSSNAMPRQG